MKKKSTTNQTENPEIEKKLRQYIINEHRLISNWISGPYLLKIVDSKMYLSLKYSGKSMDYDSNSTFIDDFTHFYANASRALTERDTKLSIHGSDLSIIYFKWDDDDDLFWAFDLKFFNYDNLVDLLTYREVHKHVAPEEIIPGILAYYSFIQKDRNAKNKTVLFFMYLYWDFKDDVKAISRQFEHRTGYFYSLMRTRPNFHDVVVRLLFWRRTMFLRKYAAPKSINDVIDLEVREVIPVEEHLLLKKQYEDLEREKNKKIDWCDDLLSLAEHCNNQTGPGKRFKNFMVACETAAQQFTVYGEEVTQKQIYKCWDNYQQKAGPQKPNLMGSKQH